MYTITLQFYSPQILVHTWETGKHKCCVLTWKELRQIIRSVKSDTQKWQNSYALIRYQYIGSKLSITLSRYKHIYEVVVKIHVYTASFFWMGGGGARTFIEVLESVMKQVQMNQLKYGWTFTDLPEFCFCGNKVFITPQCPLS